MERILATPVLMAVLAILSVLAGACRPGDGGGEVDAGARETAPAWAPVSVRPSGTMPRPIPRDSLPQPDSRGALLVFRTCSSCHGIPTPQRFSAGEWAPTLERMYGHMERLSSMGAMSAMMPSLQVPTEGERGEILAYLREHALPTVPEGVLAAGSSRELFLRACSSCHAPPDPSLHPPGAWAGVVARMRENMRTMNVKDLTDDEARAVAEYLDAAAARAP